LIRINAISKKITHWESEKMFLESDVVSFEVKGKGEGKGKEDIFSYILFFIRNRRRSLLDIW